MKRNKLTVLILITLMFGMINAKAFPQSITIGTQGEGLTLSNTDSNMTVVNDIAKGDATYPYFYVKNSNAGEVVCTDGTLDPPSANKTCSLTNWDNSGDAKAVAYIINLIKVTALTSNEKYYWTEFLVNSYLGKYTNGPDSKTNKNIWTNSNFKIPGTGVTYSQIQTNASNVAASSYTDNTLSIDLSTLSFIKNTDGYYYSSPLMVTTNGGYNVTLDNNKFSYDKTGNQYVFKIKSSDVVLGTSENLTITVASTEISKTTYIAARYDCGTDFQKVTLMTTESTPTIVATSKLLTGSVSKSYASIKVAKVNKKDKFIAGAKLMLQTEDQKQALEDGIIIESISTGYVSIEGLAAGTYYLTEQVAPLGYDKTDEEIKIIIDNDGKIKIKGVETNGTLKVLNTLTQTQISKIDVSTGKELPGATLQILDGDSKPILDAEGNELYKWISTDTATIIEGLPVGTYYLKELIAPEGYVLSEKMVKFEVKGDGNVTKVEMKNQIEVKVSDTLSSKSALLLAIAMFDIALGIGILTYVKRNKIEE